MTRPLIIGRLVPFEKFKGWKYDSEHEKPLRLDIIPDDYLSDGHSKRIIKSSKRKTVWA